MRGVVRHIQVAPDVEVHLTGASLVGLDDANLAHHRPHVPAALAAARAQVAAASGTDAAEWIMMRQVHGSAVGDADAVAPGTEIRDVDALITTHVARPLVVLTADCVPVVIVGSLAIAAVHAGWRGVVGDVVGRTVEAMVVAGERPTTLRALIGPSIGACCYAVGEEVRSAVGALAVDAVAVTRDARPAVDLVAACRARLRELGVASDTSAWECTSCGPSGWFSHRRDPSGGRQATIVVRRAVAA
jgi:YfiH family protein